MAAIGFSILKSSSSINPTSRMQLCRPCGCHTKIAKYAYQVDGSRMMGVESLFSRQYNRTNFVAAFSPTLPNLSSRHKEIRPVLIHGSKVLAPKDKDEAEDENEDELTDSGGGRVEESNTITFSHLPTSVLIRLLLKSLHEASTKVPRGSSSRTTFWRSVKYDTSFWGALEGPLQFLIPFMIFLKIGTMVAPRIIPPKCIAPAWKGAFAVAFVWFLHQLKTNVIAYILDVKEIARAKRDKLLILDKISSVGLIVLGFVVSAEASGVAVKSILTFFGIGALATAFASKDFLGNVLSGLFVQISQPFSIDDIIKVGPVEGKVEAIGLTTTSLLTAEKFLKLVPNSQFFNQVIVNKSRARCRAMVTKIPLQTNDLSKIPLISEEIKSMLKSNPNVFLEKEPKEPPYCYLSRIERSYADLTLGCNLKPMSKDELFSTKQDILLQSVQIIKKHGGNLGSSFMEDMISQYNT